MRAQRRAQIQLLVSAVLFSTAGLFMGLIHADIWTVIFWRSLFALVAASAMTLIADRHAFARPDRAGFAAAVFSASAMLAFIPALRLTAVANVAVIHGSLPLVTTLLMLLTVRGSVSLTTLGLGAMAGLGAVVIFSGSASSGSHLAGDGLALLMTCLMASMTIAFYRSRTSSYLLVAISNAMAASVGAIFSPSLEISVEQAVVLACFAVFQMTLGLIFFALGSRALSPAETALISLAEVPLSTLWVFLAFSQTPPVETVVGAGMILAAVLIHLLARQSDREAKEQRDGL
jgi:drug/metabolite transporter (DMT)-like permease